MTARVQLNEIPNWGPYSIGFPRRPENRAGWRTFVFWVICILLLGFALEEAMLGRVALSTTQYVVAKAVAEIFLYGILLLVLLARLAQGNLHRYRPTLFDYCLLLFVIAAAVSTVANKGSILQGALNVRTMLRYVSVYYIIVLSGWRLSERHLRVLVRLIVALAIFQSILAVAQHFLGDEFRDAYFSPPEISVGLSGIRTAFEASAVKFGVGYGTFGRPAALAFFLLLAAVLALAMGAKAPKGQRLRWVLGFGVMLVGIYFTYKRGVLILALVSPLVLAFVMGDRRLLIRYSLLGAIVIPGFLAWLLMVRPATYVKEKDAEVTPAESMAQLLSEEYWSRSGSQSRGWFIREVGRQAISSLKPLGYGADVERAQQLLASRGGAFAKLVEWKAFEDVYAVAALIFYGPIGVLLLISMFLFVYLQGVQVLRAADRTSSAVASSVCVLIILMIAGLFLERILEFRVFAFAFWLLAGILMVTRRTDSRNGAGHLLRQIAVENRRPDEC